MRNLEIVQISDTTIVVEVPGLGDEVQAQKAGILEIGDILVVNKSDRPGSDRLAKELQMMLSLGEEKEWKTPIVSTTATSGEGIELLWNEISNHQKYLGKQKFEAKRLEKFKYELENQISQKLFTKKIIEIGDSEITNVSTKILNREIDLPDFWGGIRIIPDEFEFWQGGERRLHDRFVYKKNKDGWSISRLSP